MGVCVCVYVDISCRVLMQTLDYKKNVSTFFFNDVFQEIAKTEALVSPRAF